MQTSETVILVEGHAERPAADMGEDFMPGVVGREEADDVALPRAGVDVVVRVENDVFGSVDLAQANDLGVAEAVVHRIGRRRGRIEERSGRQSQIAGRHIDLGLEALSPFAPAHVDGDRQQQHQADHHRRRAGLNSEPDEPVDQDARR